MADAPIAALLEQNNIKYSNSIEHLQMHFSLDSLQQLEYSEDKHFWHKNRKHLVRKLIDQHVVRDNYSGMDVGCGNGSVVHFMEKIYPKSQWTGVDGYLEGLINARQRTPTAQLEWQDITALEPLSDRGYDVALILDVLEHLDHPEQVVRNLKKILKKDAIVISTVPADMKLWSDRDVFLGHRKRYSRQNLESLFSDNGYDILKSNYAFSHLYFPAWIFRKFLSKNSSGQKVEEKELKIIPGINEIMTAVGNIEINLSRKMALPFGTSTWCVAKLR